MNGKFLSGMAVLLVAAATVVAGEIELDGVKCVVASRDAQASKSADYKEGKVYFCCNGCSSKFTKTPEKFAEQANRQLVQTKQYEQKGCPFSGGDVDPEVTLKVAGTSVAFCCSGCQGKVAKAEAEDQVKMVFGDKAFKKAFEKKSSEG
ncbi:MAG: hypothetical protein AAF670_06180 [Planctomycetota bacterium]